MMLKPKHIAFWISLSLLMPAMAQAYVSPYEVIVNPELAWPPTARDAEAKVQWQDEQRNIDRFSRVRSSEPAHAAASESAASSEALSEMPAEADLDPELKSLLRALERLQDNQERADLRAEALNMLREEGLVLIPEEGIHGSADLLGGKGLYSKGKGPLTPSGAGSTLAIMVGMTAIAWTIRRTKGAKAITR